MSPSRSETHIPHVRHKKGDSSRWSKHANSEALPARCVNSTPVPSSSHPSIPSLSSPLPSFLCLLSFHTCSPLRSLTPHLSLNSLRSREQRCLAKNMQQKTEKPAESERVQQHWGHLSRVFLLYKQVSWRTFTPFTGTFMTRCMKAGVWALWPMEEEW